VIEVGAEESFSVNCLVRPMPRTGAWPRYDIGRPPACRQGPRSGLPRPI